MSPDPALRRRVAELVLAHADARLTDKEFLEQVAPLPIGSDPAVEELVTLVRRAPTTSWLFGVNRHTVRDDGTRIAELVKEFMGP